MIETDRAKLLALRSRLLAQQSELLLRAADNPTLPASNEMRRIADNEAVIGALEALLEGSGQQGS